MSGKSNSGIMMLCLVAVLAIGGVLVYLLFHRPIMEERITAAESGPATSMQGPPRIVVPTDYSHFIDEESPMTSGTVSDPLAIEGEVKDSGSEERGPLSESQSTNGGLNADYGVGTIGTSYAKMFIPYFLTKSAIDGDEKCYSGYRTVTLITKSIPFSDLPKDFIDNERKAGMSRISESSGEDWWFETGRYKDDLYWRKVRVKGGRAYYAVFMVPCSDKENTNCYNELARRMFDHRFFPLNK